jgi:UPF0042 nucleotide-binding protein
MELLIVTGLSGAGRRAVLGALEDSGCMALDNVPAPLIEQLLDIEAKVNPSLGRLVVGMDRRHPNFPKEAGELIERLRARGVPLQVLFLESSDDVLLRRFSETRRPHPMAGNGDVAKGIARERKLLEPVREQATLILDSSDLSLSQLRTRLKELLPDLPDQPTVLRLISFGYKHGLPLEADVVLDARFLPNPYYLSDLRPLTGRDEPVRDYLMKSAAFVGFLARSEQWVRWCWPQVEAEGRAYFNVAIGCTGGQHRSVALAEMLAERLGDLTPSLKVQHRELRSDQIDTGR